MCSTFSPEKNMSFAWISSHLVGLQSVMSFNRSSHRCRWNMGGQTSWLMVIRSDFWNWPRASHLFPVVKFKMLRFGFFGGTRNRNTIDLNFLGHLVGGKFGSDFVRLGLVVHGHGTPKTGTDLNFTVVTMEETHLFRNQKSGEKTTENMYETL